MFIYMLSCFSQCGREVASTHCIFSIKLTLSQYREPVFLMGCSTETRPGSPTPRSSCSGQLTPDSILSFSSATTGGMPSLNV